MVRAATKGSMARGEGTTDLCLHRVELAVDEIRPEGAVEQTEGNPV